MKTYTKSSIFLLTAIMIISLFLLSACQPILDRIQGETVGTSIPIDGTSDTLPVEDTGDMSPGLFARYEILPMQDVTFPDIPVRPVIPEEIDNSEDEADPELIPDEVLKLFGDPNFIIQAENASEDGGEITYSSENENVATVDEITGEVTIVGAGTTFITATAAEVPDMWMATQTDYTLIVERVEGTGFVSMDGWIYGQFDPNVNMPVFSNVSEGYNDPIVEFSPLNANTWSTEIPLDVGDFTVRAVWTETNNLLEHTSSSDFTVVTYEAPEVPINISQIVITAPVTGAAPATTVDTAQFSGTISWSPSSNVFNERTVYTATITITPKTNFTLSGVAANFFTVTGTSQPATNAAGSGVITAVFPATNNAIKTIAIGRQSGTLTAGTPGDITFPVNTVNIANGTYEASVTNLPTGVSIGNSGYVTISDNSGTLTLTGNSSTIAGTRANLVLTIDGAPSGNFTIVIGTPEPEPTPEPPPDTNTAPDTTPEQTPDPAPAPDTTTDTNNNSNNNNNNNNNVSDVTTGSGTANITTQQSSNTKTIAIVVFMVVITALGITAIIFWRRARAKR